jgi:hypothetical protein
MPKCPKCNSEKVIPILWGLPTEDARERAAMGKSSSAAASSATIRRFCIAPTANMTGDTAALKKHPVTFAQLRNYHRVAFTF